MENRITGLSPQPITEDEVDLTENVPAAELCEEVKRLTAETLYDDMWNKLSGCEQYRRTGNYLEDVKRINAMKQVIEEEILNEIVYV